MTEITESPHSPAPAAAGSPAQPEPQPQHVGSSAGPNARSEPSLEEHGRAEFGRLREKLVAGTATTAEHRYFRELNDFLHFGGKVPEAMRPQPTSDPSAPYDSGRAALAPLYEAAYEAADYRPKAEAQRAVPAEALDELKGLAFAMRLPAHTGNQVIDRICHHLQHEGTGRLQSLGHAEQAAYYEAALDSFDGDAEKLHTTARKARAYLQNTLSPALFRQLDGSLMETSVAWDPLILIKLAGLFDARGWSLAE